ncbi:MULTISPECIES: type II toxin-antitoxin system PemK/MazF family toxin [unclassified Leuconostoc]|jgi:mRNA interferase MazF|uniref:type II toxin-antitoxin system PemK/MazF family toxin n=1 Tax=unclassified Leuconostoc TaxID=2685106 RepID=UPI001905802D|nr:MULTISPECIES: type II toxin-antitoxin system PemK/MazF family toxin [unclassified Leuconostoc]MBK0039777.1 type II toxin-antitoxin system PemK/MazF family toxin [Leuconostoc sp. S51]MBK0050736.1 type II toxin-antitoxin system PemK/MazF family toxin [Leuconostoc sp. S50]
MSYKPRQGDIIWLDFDPTIGAEKGKTRPALVVSDNHIQNNSKFAIVTPIIHGDWEFATHIKLPTNQSLQSDGKLHPEQTRSIDYTARKISFVKKIDDETLQKTLRMLQMFFK